MSISSLFLCKLQARPNAHVSLLPGHAAGYCEKRKLLRRSSHSPCTPCQQSFAFEQSRWSHLLALGAGLAYSRFFRCKPLSVSCRQHYYSIFFALTRRYTRFTLHYTPGHQAVASQAAIARAVSFVRAIRSYSERRQRQCSLLFNIRIRK